ncbi:hypothetical protein J2T57_002458 [Natronocella acetinitrilica]|uniref:Uncharacterized protein n=1 Tax=Natronocella acetinitrilica TaxID=414046 RepID=A0AAE3G3X4_9GAMM|nr:hypothetical protein [Natronocella acetinitrilica]MCP1675310.1 hypothetical protein [Natronocella acetinitrilica]
MDLFGAVTGAASGLGGSQGQMFDWLENHTSNSIAETVAHKAKMSEIQNQGEAALAAINVLENITSAAFQSASQSSQGFQQVA